MEVYFNSSGLSNTSLSLYSHAAPLFNQNTLLSCKTEICHDTAFYKIFSSRHGKNMQGPGGLSGVMQY